MNLDLNHYVREALARGLSRETITAQLTAARWRRDEIDGALAAWADGEGGVPVPRRRVSLSAREAFVHLLLFASLYTSAFSTGVILFALIEHWLQDAVIYSGGGSVQAMRWAVAATVTAFPIYLWMSAIAARGLAEEPEKRASGVRRWLTYLTLFVAAQVLIGNFVGVLSSLLAGEQTVRSLLKAAVVFAIAGLVFGHYLTGLRRDEADQEGAPRRPGLLGRIGAAGVVLTIALSFFGLGSPGRARGRELDARRVNDLELLRDQIERAYERDGTVPESLTELDATAGRGPESVPRDPDTRRFYAYQRVDSVRFQLGATFSTADTLDAYGNPTPLRWRHGKGLAMFELVAKRANRP
jgi:hypothetical protein